MAEEKQNKEEKTEKIVNTQLKDGLNESIKSGQLNEGLKDEKITEPRGEAKISEAKPSDEKKKPIIKKEIVKREEAVVNAKSAPISTKVSVAICKFIKRKKIDDCILYLEQVAKGKKVMPMKGEIPHRKGKGIMSGRYPKNASEHFIKILKSLRANAIYHGLDGNEAIITEAVANNASRPHGGKGRMRRKRTHVTLKCREIKSKEKNSKKTKEKSEKKSEINKSEENKK